MNELDFYVVILFEGRVLDVEANIDFVETLKKISKLRLIPSGGDYIHIPGYDGLLVKEVDYNYWTKKPTVEIYIDFPNFSLLKNDGTEPNYVKEDDEGNPGEFIVHTASNTTKYNSIIEKIYKS